MLLYIMTPESSQHEACASLSLHSEYQRITAGTIIRAMSPAGLYWPEALVLPKALYMNAGDLIFTACQFDEDHQPKNFYTEFDDPRVEECRLYAALMLSLGYDDGLVLPFPTTSVLEVQTPFDMHEPRSAGHLEALLRAEVARVGFSSDRSLMPPRPPCAGGPAYEFRDDSAPAWLQRRIYERIDVHDHLTMRGLSAYLRSQMLISRTTFIPEGLYALFVSLDATFSLVLRRLRVAGFDAPNAYDAQVFIEQAFGDDPSGLRYFQDFYEDRIRALHPESRFGAFPYPPLSMSDGYQLAKALREVWRFLILNPPTGQLE